MERSIHDNFIESIVVDCLKRTITLFTVYHDTEPYEHTEVRFSGVIAHQFHHVLKHNILFDVVEVSPDEIVKEYSSLFTDSWRWGWPEIKYDGDLERLNQALRDLKTLGYLIQSSLGCHGWVLAEKCERISEMPTKACMSSLRFDGQKALHT